MSLYLPKVIIPSVKSSQSIPFYDLYVENLNSLIYWGKKYVCSTGRGGISEEKIEGDGITPIGEFPIRCIFYREDRLDPEVLRLIQSLLLPSQSIRENDGWCDESLSDDYNTLIHKPFPYRHEDLWREEHVYDIILPLGYNDDPVIKGKGSAIFMHLVRPNYTPTEGCVAVSLEDMVDILGQFPKKELA